MMEGSRVEGWGAESGGVQLQEARERSKNRKDLQRNRERKAGGRDGEREGERGRTGQEGKGMINEGRAARWKDEEGEIECVRG